MGTWTDWHFLVAEGSLIDLDLLVVGVALDARLLVVEVDAV